MAFLYSCFLKLFYPTSLALLCLVASAILSKRKMAARICLWAAIAILMVCGNGWLVGALARHLEWQYLPPNPIPSADCILVLSGGLAPRVPPRTTVEVAEAGDRILYGAHLYRQGAAPRILCTGNVGTGGIAPSPASAVMAELLEDLGVPKNAILQESKSTNTREHARNLYPLLQEKGYKKILLVTSAMHMPRSMATFKRLCPGIEFIAAPTDFRVVEMIPGPWYRRLVGLIPTPSHLADFCEVMHEYQGMACYKLRGWM